MRRDNPAADFPDACPVCGGRLLGRIGTGQFFCWDCCAQFSRSGPRLRVWAIDDEGALVPQPTAQSQAGPELSSARDGRSERATLEIRR